ncbi:MAG TPA: gephyrin-like molybdotransferase Glp [Lichenihabitans sp.]|jgi:molybdopterin molybdotransferase|nr:gephyrin-like molybdotransferase Glp [Lichenihabitans sp.]
MAQLSDDCFAFGGPLMSIDEAVALIAARVEVVAGVEVLPLAKADGRVLAEDVRAGIALPAFANSAVDGWAVAFADLAPRGETRLPVRGRVAAGGSAEGLAAEGCAVRVFTGAPIPSRADTVFMQEDVALEGDRVVLPAGLKCGANLRPVGEDVAQGALVLPAGRSLRPQDLALASAIGRVSLPVRTRLRVALFSTGDELREPGSDLPAGAIYDANRAMLRALIERAGAVVTDLGILRDDRDALRDRLSAAAAGHDLIVTSGGVSMGEEDHVKAAVEAAGRLVFWRIGIKPGRPVAMGVIGGTPFVGLPGNPVAAFVTFCYVVRPVIARLSGGSPCEPQTVPVVLAFDYRKKQGRREFVRVNVAPGADGGLQARKFPKIGAGILTSLTDADGLVVLSEDLTVVESGAVVPFVSYAALL